MQAWKYIKMLRFSLQKFYNWLNELNWNRKFQKLFINYVTRESGLSLTW